MPAVSSAVKGIIPIGTDYQEYLKRQSANEVDLKRAGYIDLSFLPLDEWGEYDKFEKAMKKLARDEAIRSVIELLVTKNYEDFFIECLGKVPDGDKGDAQKDDVEDNEYHLAARLVDAAEIFPAHLDRFVEKQFKYQRSNTPGKEAAEAKAVFKWRFFDREAGYTMQVWTFNQVIMKVEEAHRLFPSDHSAWRVAKSEGDGKEGRGAR